MIRGGRSRCDGRLAAGHAFEHRSQLWRFEVLEQVTLSACFDGPEEVGLVLADRQHDNRDLGMALLDPGHGHDT